MWIAELSFIVLLGGLTRGVFLAVPHSNDLDVHRWLIRLRKRVGRIGRHDIDDSIIRGIFGYPPLPHYIVAAFPESLWLTAGRLLNIAYDLASIVFIFAVTNWLLPTPESSVFSSGAAVALLYATAPLLHPTTARLVAMGGRTMGPFLTNLYFVALGLAIYSGNWWWYGVCALSGIGVILSSQFALQVMVLVSLGLACLLGNVAPLAALGSVFLTAALFPRFGIRELLTRKLAHYRWYLRFVDKGTTATRKGQLRTLVSLPWIMIRKPKLAASIILRDSTCTVLCLSAPALLVLAWMYVYRPAEWQALNSTSGVHFAVLVVLSSVVACALTAKGPLRILGEAQRYVEYAVGFLCFVTVAAIWQFQLGDVALLTITLAQLALVLLNLAFMFGTSGVLGAGQATSRDVALADVAQQLRDEGESRRILTIPSKMSYALSLELADSRFSYYYYLLAQPGTGMSYMFDDMVCHELVRPDFSYFQKKYEIDTLIVWKPDLNRAERNGIHYELNHLELCYENDAYAVYRLPAISDSAVSTAAA